MASPILNVFAAAELLSMTAKEAAGVAAATTKNADDAKTV
jgi:hypothetical protein